MAGSAHSLVSVGRLYQRHRVLIWLSIVIFVNQLGFGSVVPVVPLYARSFGVSQTAIGLTVAVYGLARFMMNLPTGRLADRVGRRWTLVLGEIVTATGNLLCGFSGTYEQFLFFRLVAGAGGALVTTSGQVILADISTRSNRARTIGLYHAVFLAGNGFGPLPGGILAERFGLNVPFFAFAALGLVAAVLAFDKIPETRGARRVRAVGGTVTSADLSYLAQLGALFRRAGFGLICGVAFVQTFARTGGLFALIPLLGVLKLGLSPEQIGAALAVVPVCDMTTVYFSAVLADRFGRKRVIVPASLVAAASMALFSVAPSYGWFVASLALWGLALGLAGPAPAAYAADLAPPGLNAITMGAFRTMGDLGYVVGPILLGWLADAASLEAGLLATAGLFVLVTLPFAAFAPETGGTRARSAASAAGGGAGSGG